MKLLEMQQPDIVRLIQELSLKGEIMPLVKVEMITTNLNKTLGIEPTDVFIIMNEPPLENWGMGGKQKG